MPKGWDGIVSRYINRRFSRPIARFFAENTGVSPNQMTVISFLVGVLSGVSFLLFRPILGGILAQLCSILDGVDGDLAIITNRVTRFGGFLDSLLDRYGDSIILIGMTYYAYMREGYPTLSLLIGAAALAGSLLVSYSRARAKSDLGVVFRSGISGYAANRDVRLFIVMIGGILNRVFITLLILALLTNFTVAVRLYNIVKVAGRAEE